MHELNPSSKIQNMAEQDEVAPQESAEESSTLVSLAAEVAEAAGVESFIESASETEAETEVDESEQEEPEGQEEEIPVDDLGEPDPEPVSSGDSEGVKKRIGKLVEARKAAEEERDALKAQLEGETEAEVKTPEPEEQVQEVAVPSVGVNVAPVN